MLEQTSLEITIQYTTNLKGAELWPFLDSFSLFFSPVVAMTAANPLDLTLIQV